MSINRDNYEEFFVLYADNELNSEERLEVEQFVEQNPDLKQELELFGQLHFSPDETVGFSAKDRLLQVGGSDAASPLPEMQEAMLLFLDNELSAERQAEFSGLLERNEHLRNELELFRRTRVDASEQIPHPDKSSLYHREEKTRVIPIGWRRIAAVASLLIAVSVTALVMYNRSSVEPGSPLAATGAGKGTEMTSQRPPSAQTGEVPGSQTGEQQPTGMQTDVAVSGDANEAANAGTDASGTAATGAGTSSNAGGAPKTSNDQVAYNTGAGRSTDRRDSKGVRQSPATAPTSSNTNAPDVARHNNLPRPLNNPNVQTGIGNVRSNEAIASNTNNAQQPAQNISGSAVTPEPSDAYILASNTAANDDESTGLEQSSKKSRFRGFFRKVTRTFEKNTNIRATDDDDRLLVGGLAIRL